MSEKIELDRGKPLSESVKERENRCIAGGIGLDKGFDETAIFPKTTGTSPEEGIQSSSPLNKGEI